MLLVIRYTKSMRRIQSLPISFRPRERLLKYGPQALNIEELISVILNTGTRTMPISVLSNKIAKLLKRSPELNTQLLSKIGLGPTKIAQVLAALEIGKRLEKEKTVTLTRPEQVFACSYEIIQAEKESLLCFYLNARGELLKKELVVVGSLNKASLLPREIFSFIKELPVSGIILVHNHPSGNLDPSKEDILFTQRVKMAGDILGVKLLDHLIVSPKGWKQIKNKDNSL